MILAIGVLLSLGLLASLGTFLIEPGWLVLLACCTQGIALALLVISAFTVAS